MKHSILKLTAFLFFLLFITNGCTKEEPTPDPVAKIVSTGKQITSFKIVAPAATGIIDTTNKLITVTVPNGTAFTSLATEITIAAGHTISPASGVAQNFTTPVIYTVKRPDNSTTSWTVTVATAGVNVTEDITASVTWTADKTYFITGDINVENNAVLTIQPGTVINFNAGSSLVVGYGTNGTLIANGTAQLPITFTSNAAAPTAGAWEGLFFESHTLNNTSLAYCSILFAGSNSSYGALNISGCDLSVDHCNISNSASYGVWTYYTNNYGGFSAFTNNTINATAKYGMHMHAMKLGTIGTNNVFTNVPGVSVTGDFKSSTATTWRNLTVPYIIDSEVDIDGDLTIEPGTTFKFESNGWLAVGYFNSTTFTADGTSMLPITFTTNASSPVAGAWRGITFYGHTQTNSKMNYCVINYAGSVAASGSLHMVDVSSIIFTNNTISNGASYGIAVDPNAGFQAFTGNTINSCANHVIWIFTSHLPELGTPNTLVPASGKGILVTGDVKYSDDVIWKKQTADFYFSGGEIDIDGNVTIEAGTNILLVNDTFFWFGYYQNTKITAIGTALARITFTAAGSSPAPGAWRGIYFDSYTQSNTILSYCDFNYTGLNNKPAIYIEKAIVVSYTNIYNFSSAHAAELKTGILMLVQPGNNFSWVAN